MEALEAEKQKIAEEIQSLQKNHRSRNKPTMSMYMHNVAKAMLASLFLSGHRRWVLIQELFLFHSHFSSDPEQEEPSGCYKPLYSSAICIGLC